MNDSVVVIWGMIGLGALVGVVFAFVIHRIPGPIRRFTDIVVYGGAIIGMVMGIDMVDDAPGEFVEIAAALQFFLAVAIYLKILLLLITYVIARFMLRQAQRMVFLIGDTFSIGLVLVLFIGMMFEKSVPELLGVGIASLVTAGFVSKSMLENIGRGIVISVEPNLNVGNFIGFDGKVGRVREITTTHLVLETPLKEIILIPHRKIYDGTVINYSRPDLPNKGEHREVIGHDVNFRLGYEVSPREVEASIARFMLSEAEKLIGPDGSPFLVSYQLADQVSAPKPLGNTAPEDPTVIYRPKLIVDGFEDFFICYRLRVFFWSFNDFFPGDSRLQYDLFDHLFRDEGWRIPYPVMRFSEDAVIPSAVMRPKSAGSAAASATMETPVVDDVLD